MPEREQEDPTQTPGGVERDEGKQSSYPRWAGWGGVVVVPEEPGVLGEPRFFSGKLGQNWDTGNREPTMQRPGYSGLLSWLSKGEEGKMKPLFLRGSSAGAGGGRELWGRHLTPATVM